MLYSLLTAVIILSFLVPLTGVMCFIKGYNLNAEKHGEKSIVTPKIPHKKPKQTLEQINAEILLDNIENFDGSGVGQKEFENGI